MAFRLGTVFADDLSDSDPANAFFGLPGPDTISLGFGANFAFGGLNNDVFVVSGGLNQVWGGADNDTFMFVDTPGVIGAWTTIGDFTQGEDVIDVSDIADSMWDINVRSIAGETLLEVGNHRIWLNGIEASSVTEDDFIF